jgi:hypothetical protein
MLLKDYKQPLYQNVREQSFADTEMFMRAWFKAHLCLMQTFNDLMTNYHAKVMHDVLQITIHDNNEIHVYKNETEWRQFHWKWLIDIISSKKKILFYMNNYDIYAYTINLINITMIWICDSIEECHDCSFISSWLYFI